MAKDKPRDWAQTVKILASLGGFSERKEVRSGVVHMMVNMSDEDLERATMMMETGLIKDISEYQSSGAIPVESSDTES